MDGSERIDSEGTAKTEENGESISEIVSGKLAGIFLGNGDSDAVQSRRRMQQTFESRQGRGNLWRKE
jgi:hypothetical protein